MLLLITFLFTVPSVSLFGVQWYVILSVEALVAVVAVTVLLIVTPSRGPRIPSPVYSNTIRGLVPFDERDKSAFATLGRKSDISRIVQSLLLRERRFVCVYGESGSGKTSLLRAGVLPELKDQGHKQCYWGEVSNREKPLALIRRLLRFHVPASSVIVGPQPGGKYSDSDSHAFLSQFDHLETPVLVILDQFEQLFVQYGNQEELDAFLAFLQQWWVSHPNSQLRILVSMREDYLGKLGLIQKRVDISFADIDLLPLWKFRPDEAVEVLRSMANESHLEFDEAVSAKPVEKSYLL